MADLPTGTVTFLLTDIAGSTRLWEQDAAAMRQALAHHDALVDACVTQHGGVVVRPRGEGDSRFAVFARATDAVAAAAALQQALWAEAWLTADPLRVRLALHTGESDLRDGDYYGAAVNRCARLRAVAHGGQTLLSAATQELVRDHLPVDAVLRDLGTHPLADLHRPEHIFQLVTPDLPADFPPLNTLDRRSTNLPLQPTPFIGREREVAAVKERLLRPEVRLLTLTGAGGTGKTRLALQVAADLLDAFADGVYFVNLALISAPDLVAATIAQALAVKELGSQPLLDSLKASLQAKQLLVLLDNFEQVVAAAPLLAELLATAPHLKVLVTSRAVLHLQGEQEYPVPPLVLPDPAHLPDLTTLSQSDAVALFLQRAQAAQPDFRVTTVNGAAIAEICIRLDGLPLAIELAAARIKLLPPQALLARLSNRLRLLTGGSRDLPARQQTLRSTIDWSYHLLADWEQTLFCRLGVFVSGCTIEAAEAVCNSGGEVELDVLEGLQGLLDKSLLRQAVGADGEPRFSMLETIREYALERLMMRGDAEAIRRMHTTYYVALAEAAEPELTGPQQGTWLARLEREHDNLRAALHWSLNHDEREALRLGGALWRFWWMHDHLSEGRRWLEEMLQQSRSRPMSAQPKALIGAAVLAWVQGDLTEALAVLEEGLALSREFGDKRSIAIASNVLGVIINDMGDYARAQTLYQESLAGFRELNDRWGLAVVLHNLGEVAQAQGDYMAACALYEESLAIEHELGNAHGMAISLSSLGCVEKRRDNYARASALFAKSLTLFRAVGDRRGLAECLEGVAGVLGAYGQPGQAACLWGAAEALRTTLGAPLSPVDAAENDRNIGLVRAQLDPASFAAAWAAGQGMLLEQAIDFALEHLWAMDLGGPAAQPPRLEAATPTRRYPAGLTQREVEVLRLVAQGLTNEQVAETLIVSPRTVEKHLESIYGKLDVKSRSAATRFAVEHSLIALPTSD